MESRTVVGLAVVAGSILWLLDRRASGQGLTLPLVRGADGSFYYPGASAQPTAAQTAEAYRQAATQAATQAGYQPYVDPTPGVGSTLVKTGTTAGIGVTAAALAPGALTATALAIPIIGAGVAALAYFVGVKGLWRGGEEALQVSPRRDMFLAQFGPSGDASAGVPWEQTGANKLAVALTEITGEPDGSHYWKQLMGAQDMETFVPATREIQALLSVYGIRIEAF